MAAKASLTKIPAATQEKLIEFSKQCTNLFNSNWDIRTKLRELDLNYFGEKDLTEEHIKAKLQHMFGNTNALQNLTVPVVKPQIEAAVAYQSSVFLSGHPMFGVISDAKNMDAAMQMESIIEDQQTRDRWVLKLQKVLRDGFKYNLGAAEVAWKSIKTAAVETTTEGTKPTTTIWTGNCIEHLDMYNTFWDTRVRPSEIPEKAEFVGWKERVSRTALKAYINSLDEVIIGNTRAAFEAPNSQDYYVPQISQGLATETISPGTTNWLAWAAVASEKEPGIQYKDTYEKTTLYARIIPNDFGLDIPAKNTPQVWKFIIINNSVVVYAERQTNAHNLIPVFFVQPYDDGLGYQTKSMAADVTPMQQVSSTLMNSVLAARRRSIYDRSVYDPSKINPKDMNSPNPISNIPIRQTAYGTDIRTAFAPFPYNDNQSGMVLGEINSINALANEITGQNKAQQGQFVKGNKTREEYSDVMGNANARSQTVSIALEDQFFAPLKEVIKINILQYQGGVTLYNKEYKKNIKVDPVKLRQAILEFKMSDGLLPTDKILNGSAFQVALQMLAGNPQFGQEYNLGELVSYLFKTQGADIGQFEKSNEQKSFEQAMNQWQQTAMAYLEQDKEFKVPQPNPADYGLDPRTGEATNEEPEPPTILEQVMSAGEQNGNQT